MGDLVVELAGSILMLIAMIIALRLLHPVRRLRFYDAAIGANRSNITPFRPTTPIPSGPRAPRRRAA